MDRTCAFRWLRQRLSMTSTAQPLVCAFARESWHVLSCDTIQTLTSDVVHMLCTFSNLCFFFVTCDIEIKVTTSRTSCLSEELFACHARFLRGRHRRVFVRSLLTFFVNKNVFTAMIHCLHVTYFADIQYDVNICCARSAACERFQYIFLRFVYNVCEGFCCAK